MTASRSCRACGATLTGDVMWCLRCYEPVRHLTPREAPLPPLPSVLEPVPEPRMSRWRAGPTTFGPLGRLVCTAIVLAFAPWSGLTGFSSGSAGLTLWWLLGWSVAAALVLRAVWRKEHVLDDRPGPLERLRVRLRPAAPRLGREMRVPARVLVAALGLPLLAVITYLWLELDAVGRYHLVSIAIAGGVGLFLAFWNEL